MGEPSANDFDFAPNAPPAPKTMAPSTTIADGVLNDTTGKQPKKRRYTMKKNRPKRPLSAYNFFFKYKREMLVRETLVENGEADDENVEEVVKSKGRQTRTGKRAHRKTHGAIGFAEMGRRISEAWRALSEEERAPFQAEADKDKKRYEDELSAMPPSPPDDHAGKPNAGDRSYGANEKEFGGSMDMEDEHRRRPAYNNAQQHHYPPGHHVPVYYDYRGYYGNERMAAPSAFAPPRPNGPGSPPRYPPHHYQSHPSPNENNPQHPTAHAFAPPMPATHFRQTNNPHYPTQSKEESGKRQWEETGITLQSDPEAPRDYAFQCEVCNSAVFSTFEECADHEAQCTGGNDAKKPEPSPNTKKAVQQAGEAIMMLKKPVEC